MKKCLLAWSSGKDSAWTLHALRRQNIEVSALLTTINEVAGRVAMHGVRSSLLQQQADSIGLPVWQIPLPWPCTNDDYEARMADACRRAVNEGFGTIAFGDLYLQDVRAYRERQLTGSGLAPVFPLWEIPTAILARDMIDGGLRARLSCIDSRVLDASFSGREFDRACSPPCRNPPTPAAKTASSTPSSTMAPCSASPSPFRPEKCATWMASSTRICCDPCARRAL